MKAIKDSPLFNRWFAKNSRICNNENHEFCYTNSALRANHSFSYPSPSDTSPAIWSGLRRRVRRRRRWNISQHTTRFRKVPLCVICHLRSNFCTSSTTLSYTEGVLVLLFFFVHKILFKFLTYEKFLQ